MYYIPNYKPKEKCAVFGIYGYGNASHLVKLGLLALQHRGQESTGICSSDNKKIYIHKKIGLVTDVYAEENLNRLTGSIAIGHNRYSTSGGSIDEHIQPIVDDDAIFALAHNGNLPTTLKLESFLKEKGSYIEGRNDSELMYDAIKYYLLKGYSPEESVKKCFSLFTGAFSLLLMTKDKLIAIRDEHGIRPLSIGSLGESFVFSSETCGLDILDAKYIRDVNPGEMVVVDKNGFCSYLLKEGKEKLDIFEMIYFARPDSILLNKRVNSVRKELGKELAREYTINADVVIPVPDSAVPMALGYAEQSGIKFDHGLIKNRYLHRTFIEPDAANRVQKVRMKFNPIIEVISGKNVIVIDDSIVRGTTSKMLIKMIKDAGASQVHLLSASPPIKYPDYYGIDLPDQKDLIAANMSIKEIAIYLGVDSLYYLSYKGLIKAMGLKEEAFCTSCFTGIYPISIGRRSKEIIYKNN